MKNSDINHIGEIRTNNLGTIMKIVEYNSCADLIVEFQDNYKARIKNTYSNFKRGQIKNPYDKSVYGIGMIGEGIYKARYHTGSKSKDYECWGTILSRCYFEPYKEKYCAYYGITTMCSEWFIFQNFAKWYNENKYDLPNNERLHIDKDILIPGNTLYSPDTCLLVPQRINMLFMNKPNKRGLPNGITYEGKKYHAKYNGTDIGSFDTLAEAYDKYAKTKEEKIKLVAEEYKAIIPHNVYLALINYKCLIENDKNYIAS